MSWGIAVGEELEVTWGWVDSVSILVFILSGIGFIRGFGVKKC